MPDEPPPDTSPPHQGGGAGAAPDPASGHSAHERALPRGRHPFQLYSIGSPNGQKVTIMFEELLAAGHAGAEYDAWLVSIMDDEQFGSGFVAINPNAKIPALLDLSGAAPIRVFESGAILLHLAERFGAFLPPAGGARAECLSWLMWQMSTAPALGGGFGHFFAVAPVRLDYAIERYATEARRIFAVADRRLAESRHIAGADYTIADIALFGWLNYFMRGNAYRGARFLDVGSYAHIGRWLDEIAARPAVRRGLVVNRTGAGELRERHDASDIDAVLRQPAAPAGGR